MYGYEFEKAEQRARASNPEYARLMRKLEAGVEAERIASRDAAIASRDAAEAEEADLKNLIIKIEKKIDKLIALLKQSKA